MATTSNATTTRKAPPHTAAVLGATGNCGVALVKELSASPEWSSIKVVSRRSLEEYNNMPKVQEEIVRMDTTDNFAQDLNKIFQDPPDACFCTMGVGNPKHVTAENLEQVDCTLPSVFAKTLAKAGTKHACLLSAVGSDIDSKPSKIVSALAGSAWAVYPHVKGQVEQNFANEPFQSVTLVRPSMLLGNSNTPGQGIIRGTSFLMPTKYKPIEIVDLAQAMSAQALEALKETPETRPTILEGTSLFWWVDKAKSIMTGSE
jgi:nucleoside-diphosphate-sugar epimerase